MRLSGRLPVAGLGQDWWIDSLDFGGGGYRGGGGGWDLSWAFVVSLEWRNRKHLVFEKVEASD